MELPYYMTPLVGALAWAILASPRTGFSTSSGTASAAAATSFDIYSPFGIAWVMALFEGTVAFVMISAAMKSMDPSLEETSRVLGAGKLRTDAEGDPAAGHAGGAGRDDVRLCRDAGLVRRRLVLGIPGRYYVITTAIWQATTSLPARLRPRRGDGDRRCSR